MYNEWPNGEDKPRMIQEIKGGKSIVEEQGTVKKSPRSSALRAKEEIDTRSTTQKGVKEVPEESGHQRALRQVRQRTIIPVGTGGVWIYD